MTLVLGTVGGAVLGAMVLAALRPTLDHAVLERVNHRGAKVATGAGLAVVLAVIGAEALLGLAEAAGMDPTPEGIVGRRLVALAVLGFGLLGFVDDLLGVGESGGFAGHLTALAKGRLTSGGVKLVGGGALAIVVMAAIQPGSVGRMVADGALVALSANLANLLDRAPGRCLKASLIAFLILASATAADPALIGVALVIGAGIGLIRADLGERVMLGDTGANVLGAALGIGVVLSCSPATRTVVLIVVAGLNLLSERVSYSKVINGFAPLRALDRLGRKPPE